MKEIRRKFIKVQGTGCHISLAGTGKPGRAGQALRVAPQPDIDLEAGVYRGLREGLWRC